MLPEIVPRRPDRRPRSARRGSTARAGGAPRRPAAGAAFAPGQLSGRVSTISSRSNRAAVSFYAPGISSFGTRNSSAWSTRFCRPSVPHRARRPATCSRPAGGSPMSFASTDWPNTRLAFGGGQQAVQHFHRCRLAAAVGAEEAEDLAALDPEADVIDCRRNRRTAGSGHAPRSRPRPRRGPRGDYDSSWPRRFSSGRGQ